MTRYWSGSGTSPVQGRAVRAPYRIQSPQIRRRAAGEHVSAGREGLHHGGSEPVAFLETGVCRSWLETRRAAGDVQEALQLGQELDECAVTTGRTRRAFRRCGVLVPDGLDRYPCCRLVVTSTPHCTIAALVLPV
jgi:hypothetical protein